MMTFRWRPIDVRSGTACERRARGRWSSMSEPLPHRSLFSRWFSGARVRILASILFLVLLSAFASVLLLRQILLTRLDEEINTLFRQEEGEFRRLLGGRDPRTGEPFGSDVKAVFDVFFSRNVPGEGEAFIAMLGRRIYRTDFSRNAADLSRAELRALSRRWIDLSAPDGGRLESVEGPLRYLAIPIKGASADQAATFAVVNFPEAERAEITAAIRTAAQVF